MAATWQWILGPAAGGHTAALTRARDRKATFKLTDPSEAGFVMDGRAAEAASLAELATDLHLVRDGELLYRGRVGPTTDTVGAAQHAIDVRTFDYRELLQRRLLWADSVLTWNTDQGQLVWGLVQQTQARTGGDLGITRGLGEVGGVTRARTYAAGDSIGDAIRELAALIDGFDWDVVPVSATALRLDLWHGATGRGTDRGVVLEYGAGVARFTRQVDVGTYANAMRVTGTDATLVQTRQAADLGTRPEGRWDAVYGHPNITTQVALSERADWQLDDAQAIRPVYTVSLTAGAWGGPTHVWVGDVVRLRVKSGRLAVDTQLRVHEVSVAVAADGTEQVDITLGGPRPNYQRRPLDVTRRLRNLERR